jgi:hypothetical protein
MTASKQYWIIEVFGTAGEHQIPIRRYETTFEPTIHPSGLITIITSSTSTTYLNALKYAGVQITVFEEE